MASSQTKNSSLASTLEKKKFDRPQSILSQTQQSRLDERKNQLRVDNEIYFREHPEIRQIVSYFVNETLKTRPENILTYSHEILGDSNLQSKVEAYVKEDKAINE